MRVNIRSKSRSALLAKYSVCLIDDIDVTNDCYAADSTKGFALCYKRDDKGHFYLEDNGRVARELRQGKVDLSLRKDAPEFVRRLWKEMQYA